MKKTVKYIWIVTLLLGMISICAGCGEKELPHVKISIWSDESSIDLMNAAMEKFKESHKEEVDLEFVISPESEMTCKETVLASPEVAADIFAYADDQMDELLDAGALLEITSNTDAIQERVGGPDTEAVMSAKRDGKLYAYPLAAGNGYFLYYNDSYFNEKDVDSFDRMLDVAIARKKKVTMDLTSGWYLYSFFKGAGFDLRMTKDRKTNICNWNGKTEAGSGVDVVNAVLDIAENVGFESMSDDALVQGIQDKTVIACVSGAWNAEKIKEVWGAHIAATKLPTYTLNGKQVQMNSFTGYKLVSVNAHTKNPEWAMKIAEYLTSDEIQLKRFENQGDCPVNVTAAQKEEVQSSVVAQAIVKQSKYAHVQRVAGSYWEPTAILGTSIASGNPDLRDEKELLDEAVKQITSEPEE